MKKFTLILIISLLLPVVLSAKKIYEAEKVINHSFPASSSHTLTVDNKYGNINIVAWDKNEVSATITVYGKSSRSQEVANDLVNRVTINANVSGNNINFQTVYATKATVMTSGTQSNEVNYEIKVPHNISFNLTNKYGNIDIDECGNTAIIDVKYGNFYCTKMAGKSCSLTLGYGNANVQDVNSLSADIKYSNMTLSTAKTLKLTTKYSNFKFSSIENLSIYSGYDGYRIAEVGTANIEAKYSSVEIDKVNENLSLINKYGGVTIGEVGSKAKSLKFELGYTDLKLNISPSINYEFDGYTRYGKILLPSNITINDKHRETEKNTTIIKATVGNGAPTLKVTASNSYADIKLTAK